MNSVAPRTALSVVREGPSIVAVVIRESPPKVVSLKLDCPFHNEPPDKQTFLRLLRAAEHDCRFLQDAPCKPGDAIPCLACFGALRDFAAKIRDALGFRAYMEVLEESP